MDKPLKPDLTQTRERPGADGSGPDLSYETNQIDRLDNSADGSIPAIVKVRPSESGDLEGNKVFIKNNRGQAIDNPNFTEEDNLDNAGPRLHTGRR